MKDIAYCRRTVILAVAMVLAAAVTVFAPQTVLACTQQEMGTGPAMPTQPGPSQPVLGTINISLTDQGISKEIGQAEPGLYDVVITNNSSRTRGLEMIGPSLCCTEYVRFSDTLRPGASDTFRWYFAPGKVILRDYFSASKTATAYTNIRYAGSVSSIVFGAEPPAGAGPSAQIPPSPPLLGTLNITITDQGILVGPQPVEAGLYNVVVTNAASGRRGVVIAGPGLCCTQYNRFTNVLRRGQSDTFRWYFAPGEVSVRSFSRATKTATAYTNVGYTGQGTTLMFQ